MPSGEPDGPLESVAKLNKAGAKQASPKEGGSKLPHSKAALLECASLLAPSVAAACCRAGVWTFALTRRRRDRMKPGASAERAAPGMSDVRMRPGKGARPLILSQSVASRALTRAHCTDGSFIPGRCAAALAPGFLPSTPTGVDAFAAASCRDRRSKLRRAVQFCDALSFLTASSAR